MVAKKFHMSNIVKPQNEYNITVNNANTPFHHLCLETSDDGHTFIHPLEKHSVMEFVDKDVKDVVPMKPPSIESTPFKLVEEIKDLKDLADKLHSVDEFAVDLEYNKYRSFQGLTCLMQISTRTEDFVVDTLRLHIHIGPYLRDVFKDPTKRKVMHGADQDVACLQRDFGIYMCNLFDTHQASRVLKLERNSLAHLLHHFCEVTADKEYQTADWRLRPLPGKMLRYAREDTHHLLHLHDLIRLRLLSLSTESANSDSPLVEVYKKSYEVCKRLYEKQLFTENSYLNLYGLQGAGLNAQQLAIVSGLYEWRDAVARAEDESTGYVLPNRSIIEIAKQMPITTTTSMLRQLEIFHHPCVERDLDAIVNIIRHSLTNAPAFEKAAQELKGGIEEAVQELKGGIEEAAQELKEGIEEAAQELKGGIEEAAQELKGGIEEAAQELKGGIEEAAQELKGGIEEAAQELKGGIEEATQELKGGIEEAAQELKGGIEEATQELKQGRVQEVDIERNKGNNCHMYGYPLPRFAPMPVSYFARGFRLRPAPQPYVIPRFWPSPRLYPTMIPVHNGFIQPHLAFNAMRV